MKFPSGTSRFEAMDCGRVPKQSRTLILERLLDDLLYNAPAIGVQSIPITPAYVREWLGALVADEDLTRYIL